MIQIYTKPNCPWCVKAKELMRNLGLQYKELKYEVDFTRDDIKKMLGENVPLTLPQIFVNGKRVGGFEAFAEYTENHGMQGIQT